MRSSIQAMARRVIAWTRWGAPRVMPSLPAFLLRCQRRLFDRQHCHSEATRASVAAAQIVELSLAILPQEHLSPQRLTSFTARLPWTASRPASFGVILALRWPLLASLHLLL